MSYSQKKRFADFRKEIEQGEIKWTNKKKKLKKYSEHLTTVEAMIDGVYEADEERLVTVNSEIQRLSRLVNALLKLSRLENRGEPMKEEVVNVGELISGIVATHEMFVSDSGLTRCV